MPDPVWTKGSTRSVLVVGGFAIKRALDDLGRRCNLHEAALWNRWRDHPRGQLLCPVLWCSDDGLMLVMRAADPADPAKVKDICDRLPKLWDARRNDPADEWPMECKPEDWGEIDGRTVAVDYAVIPVRDEHRRSNKGP